MQVHVQILLVTILDSVVCSDTIKHVKPSNLLVCHIGGHVPTIVLTIRISGAPNQGLPKFVFGLDNI